MSCVLAGFLLTPVVHSQARPATPAGDDDYEVPVTARPPARAPTQAVAPAPPVAVPPAVVTPPESELVQLRALVERLSTRLEQLERASAPRVVPAAPAPANSAAAAAAQGAGEPATQRVESLLGLPVFTSAARPDVGSVLDPVGVVLSGYLQAQYESSQLSEDQLAPGGAALNRERFVLRRGRVRVDGSWQWVAFAFELDASTTRGPFASVRRAEASVLWRAGARGQPPLAMLTMGLTEVPFGFELVDSPRRRVFTERSRGSLAFFPGEPDLGLRLSGGLSWFRYSLAVVNGVPWDDRPGGNAVEFNAAKDFAGRLGFDSGVQAQRWQLSGGASLLVGSGFHPGTDATQGSVQWRDLNENNVIDTGELQGVAAQAATPSSNFARWAVNVDLSLRVRTPLGWSRLYGECSVATNLDRGAAPSDPVVSGYDLRQLAGYAGFTQEVTRCGLLGFRWDYYNPNVDFGDNRRGSIVPADQGVHTLSPLLGLTLPERARLLFQYDFVLDHLGRDARGVPADLPNNQWTLRAQVEL